MKTDLIKLMDEVLGWPAGDQAELAAYADKIRARRRQSRLGDGMRHGRPSRNGRSRSASDRQIETFWQRRGG
jgi:hypothetical protein